MASLEFTGLDEYVDGRLNNESLEYMLRFTNKKQDFEDIAMLFTPTPEDRLKTAIDAARTVYTCRFDKDECGHE